MLSRLIRRVPSSYQSYFCLTRNYIHNVRDAGNQDQHDKTPMIVLFPGQGSEFVGMAKTVQEIPEARQLFDEASEILK